jgi:hypothetical protein
MFALCKGKASAVTVAEAISGSFSGEGLMTDTFVSTLNSPGASVTDSV